MCICIQMHVVVHVLFLRTRISINFRGALGGVAGGAANGDGGAEEARGSQHRAALGTLFHAPPPNHKPNTHPPPLSHTLSLPLSLIHTFSHPLSRSHAPSTRSSESNVTLLSPSHGFADNFSHLEDRVPPSNRFATEHFKNIF